MSCEQRGSRVAPPARSASTGSSSAARLAGPTPERRPATALTPIAAAATYSIEGLAPENLGSRADQQRRQQAEKETGDRAPEPSSARAPGQEDDLNLAGDVAPTARIRPISLKSLA